MDAQIEWFDHGYRIKELKTREEHTCDNFSNQTAYQINSQYLSENDQECEPYDYNETSSTLDDNDWNEKDDPFYGYGEDDSI